MNKFKFTFWLLVPEQKKRGEAIDFMQSMGRDATYLDDVPCADSRTILKSGFALEDEGDVPAVLERAQVEGVSFDVYVCREGCTHGSAYEVGAAVA